jgi:hypothetical protein
VGASGCTYDAYAGKACRDLYARSRTAADSAATDPVMPAPGRNGAGLLCREVRLQDSLRATR